VAPERLKVRDEQQQLRADERADDDVDAEIHYAIGVEAALPCADQRELQTEQIRGGQQDAIGIDCQRSEVRNRPGQFKQLWIHARLVPAYRELSRSRRQKWRSRRR